MYWKMLKNLQLPDVISMSGWDLKLQKATLNLNLWIKKKKKKKKNVKLVKKFIVREGLIACYNCIDVRNAKFRH